MPRCSRATLNRRSSAAERFLSEAGGSVKTEALPIYEYTEFAAFLREAAGTAEAT